jgi:hypothetical protein
MMSSNYSSLADHRLEFISKATNGCREFFTQDSRRLGDKRSPVQQIHKITGIAVSALWGRNISQFSIEERLGWAASQQTSHEED